jgi:hypothetical protein
VTYRDNLYRYNEFHLRHCVALNLDDQNLNSLAVEMSNRTEEDSENWFSKEPNKVGCNTDLGRTGRQYQGIIQYYLNHIVLLSVGPASTKILLSYENYIRAF